MASPPAGGAGPKKVKGTKLHITEFLKPAPSSAMSWADELDVTESGVVEELPALPDVPEVGSYGRSPPTFGGRALAGSPRGSGLGPRSPPGRSGAPPFPSHGAPGGVPPAVLPDRPPYKAFIGNLPHAVEERDIGELFSDLQINDILLLRHRDTGNPKGAFVEFSSAEEVGVAVSRNGVLMMGRPLRIDVAEAKPDRGHGGFGSGFGRREVGFDRPRDSGFGFGANRFDDDVGGGRSWRSAAPADEPAPSGEERGALGERASLTIKPAAPAKPRSNPFGDAKPVDITAKLKELEERDAARKAEAAAAATAARQASGGSASATSSGGGGDGAAVPMSPTARTPVSPTARTPASPTARAPPSPAARTPTSPTAASSGAAAPAAAPAAAAAAPAAPSVPKKNPWQIPAAPPPADLSRPVDDVQIQILPEAAPAAETAPQAPPVEGGRGGRGQAEGGREGRGRRGGRGEGRGGGRFNGEGRGDWAPRGGRGGRGRGRGSRGGGRFAPQEGGPIDVSGPPPVAQPAAGGGPGDSEWSEQNSRRRQGMVGRGGPPRGGRAAPPPASAPAGGEANGTAKSEGAAKEAKSRNVFDLLNDE